MRVLVGETRKAADLFLGPALFRYVTRDRQHALHAVYLDEPCGHGATKHRPVLPTEGCNEIGFPPLQESFDHALAVRIVGPDAQISAPRGAPQDVAASIPVHQRETLVDLEVTVRPRAD